jgi:adenosylcobinamide-phosphate synthase
MDILLVLLIALALDTAFGDPPNRWHPVAWLGGLIGLEFRLAPRCGTKRQLIYGGLMVLLIVAAASAAAYFLFNYLRVVQPVAFVILGGITLKLTLSLRGLRQAALLVKRQVVAASDAGARQSLKALVSRNTANLTPEEMLGAAVASVAENSCDSFTAPLFYFLIFGLPGAVAYRVVNTYDAMVGYHGEYEYLGKAAARLDDLLNLIPARLTALTLVAAAWLCRQHGADAWRAMRRDHRRTPSPNAGWTMSAVAGALDVKLEKPGVYAIGGARPASPGSVDTALRLLTTGALVWSLGAIAITGAVHVIT